MFKLCFCLKLFCHFDMYLLFILWKTVDNAQPSSRGKRVSTYRNDKTILSRNKVRIVTYFTFSILFAEYKREEVEIRHVPSFYDKTQLPSLTSTQLVFFDEVHVKQVCGPPSTSPSNDKICLYEYVGKLKGIGKQGKVKINNINVHTIADELKIHTIADLQLF